MFYGQGYDGAGAMAGKRKGVAARIMNKYPKALYTHHASASALWKQPTLLMWETWWM